MYILRSSQGNCTTSTQVTDEGLVKYRLYHETETVTGIDITTLTECDGSYYTEDGENIIDIYNAAIGEAAKNGTCNVPAQYIPNAKEHFANMVSKAAANGWSDVSDMILSIDYKSDGLHDLYQNYSYGEGDTDWMESILNASTFNTLP